MFMDNSSNPLSLFKQAVAATIAGNVPFGHPGRSLSVASTLSDRSRQLGVLGRRQGHRGGQRLHPRGYLPALERPLRNEAGRRAKAPSRRWRRPNGATSSCIQEERVVAAGQQVAWNGGRFADSASSRAGALRARQAPHHSPNGELAVFHGPRRLVRWLASQEDDTIPLSPAA